MLVKDRMTKHPLTIHAEMNKQRPAVSRDATPIELDGPSETKVTQEGRNLVVPPPEKRLIGLRRAGAFVCLLRGRRPRGSNCLLRWRRNLVVGRRRHRAGRHEARVIRDEDLVRLRAVLLRVP